ncbi:MAG: phytanoyl-CoA dioxygenase family protein [Alphaproteobacteria bacterium]|nr:MAG: phytanoyl-CoA dioxygenase family protein [Alphaproteobacteria bacterium]
MGEMPLRLETDGAAIVRGFLSHRQFSRIAEIVGYAFAFLDAGGGDAGLRENWILVGTIWMTNLEHCVAPELARELVTDICSIRRLTDWHRRLEWHTDYHGGGTAHYDPCFNIWLPLTAVGREQPSVELVRGSHRRMRELPPSETGVFTDEWVAEHFPPTDRIVPELEPRDALIFDHSTLHRTQPLERETVSRMSIECRVSRHPAYLAVAQARSPRMMMPRQLGKLASFLGWVRRGMPPK